MLYWPPYGSCTLLRDILLMLHNSMSLDFWTPLYRMYDVGKILDNWNHYKNNTITLDTSVISNSIWMLQVISTISRLNYIRWPPSCKIVTIPRQLSAIRNWGYKHYALTVTIIFRVCSMISLSVTQIRNYQHDEMMSVYRFSYTNSIEGVSSQ